MRARAPRFRPFVPVLHVSPLVLAGLLAACGGAGERAAERPTFAPGATNLVLVTLDTVRADRLPSYGYSGIETPALDALAREGIRFANAASTVPFTLPAHSSILTGVYPPRHGVRENVGYELGGEVPTAAERLRGAGYETAGFVSAFVLDSRWGIGRGFDTYFDEFDPSELESANLASAQRDGAETVDAAIRWLDARSPAQPFFLWLHLYDAHDPYTPPEPFASRYPDRPYEAEIAYVDAQLGRLVAALGAHRLLDTTALLVTADHGEGLGEHRERYHGFFVYDATVHVPLFVRLPPAVRGTTAGTTVETAVSHVDLVPTLLELAGQPPASGLDGTSLLGVASAPPDAARAVYVESLYPLLHYGWAPLPTLHTPRYKYVEAPRAELYALARDRDEALNAIDTERREATALKGALAELRARLDSAAPEKAKPADLDTEAAAQLAALGYLAGEGGVGLDEEDATERADPKDKIDLHHAVMVAQSALGAGEKDDARRTLERIVSEDAGLLDAHQMLGSLAMEEKRFDDALGSFRRALALNPEHRASLFGLANAYRRTGRTDEALVGFERLLALAPHDSKAALAASDLLAERGESERALALLEKASAGADAPPIVANQLGELLVTQGRKAEAKAAFERALAASAELSQPHFNLGVLAEEAGDAEGATRHYEAAIERAPKSYQALFNLGRLAGERGDVARQRELWQRAIDANPGFVRGYYYLAKLLMDQGVELARAEELARAGLAREGAHANSPFGHFLLADLLNRTGRPEAAEVELRKGRELEQRARSGSAAGPARSGGAR